MSKDFATAHRAGGDGRGLPIGGTDRSTPEPTPVVAVRPARDADAPAVIDLVRTAWSEFPGKELLIVRDGLDLVSPASTYARAGGIFWVVERDDEIIGSIALRPSGGAMVELRRFYVARDARKLGLGAVLFGLFEEEAARRGASMIELWTDARMLDAQRLYQKVGFRRSPGERRCLETGTIRYRYEKQLGAAASAGTTARDILDALRREPLRAAVGA
jgi:putative acetyltransferase